jgi:hypothetical protein
MVLALLAQPLAGCGGSGDTPEVKAVKDRPFLGATTGKWLDTFCKPAVWHFDQSGNMVVFRGKFVPTGEELVMVFVVFRGGSESFTVLQRSATLNGRHVDMERVFRDQAEASAQ